MSQATQIVLGDHLIDMDDVRSIEPFIADVPEVFLLVVYHDHMQHEIFGDKAVEDYRALMKAKAEWPEK